jgi:hypothetical protein
MCVGKREREGGFELERGREREAHIVISLYIE